MLEAVMVTAGFGNSETLSGASFAVDEAEVVAVMGPSGSGKSTLLFCLAGLLQPAQGIVRFAGRDLAEMTENSRSKIRLREFGFVFQFGDLVPELTVVENVELPLRFAGIGRVDARKRAIDTLTTLGIAELGGRRTFEVSGGEQQRVAVARAVAHRPKVIFADEPTGALDEHNGALVLSALVDAARSRGSSVVLVTHDADVADVADRVVQVRNGQVHKVGSIA